MFVELHLIQNFAPSNLNRDDTGAPKDCTFGGFRRARISSQCLKRAARCHPAFRELLAATGGIRTRRLVAEIAARIPQPTPPSPAVFRLVANVFKAGGIELAAGKKKKGVQEDSENTKLLLFVGRSALGTFAEAIATRREGLESDDSQQREEAVRELGDILVHAVNVPDIALFGRMVEIDASKPFGKLQLGVDAACQVAHAISTHAATVEFDYFTAVDDLLEESGQSGAAMIDATGFNSACFYRYANVDMLQLLKNLRGDGDLAHATLEAFLRASILAVPSGKQHSTAAQNPPSFIFAVVRDHGLWSLANAFVQPVRADGTDLVQKSMEALDRHWSGLVGMYGVSGVRGRWACWMGDGALPGLADARVPDVEAVVSGVLSSLEGVAT